MDCLRVSSSFLPRYLGQLFGKFIATYSLHISVLFWREGHEQEPSGRFPQLYCCQPSGCARGEAESEHMWDSALPRYLRTFFS